MDLTGVREDLAARVAAVTDATVAVSDGIPDTSAMPAVVLWWADPWLTPDTLCNQWQGRISLYLMANRADPNGALATIEHLVQQVLPVLDADPFALADLQAPAATTLSGVDYIAARLTVSANIEG